MENRHLFKGFGRRLGLAVLVAMPMLAFSQDLIPAPFEEDSKGDSAIEKSPPPAAEQKDSVSPKKNDSLPQVKTDGAADSTVKESNKAPSAGADSRTSGGDSVKMVEDTTGLESDSGLAESWEEAVDSVATDSLVADDSNMAADSVLSDSLANMTAGSARDSLAGDSVQVQVKDSANISDSLIIPPLENVKVPEEKETKRDIAVRASQVNTIDDMKGKYKSPKKALFMSLVLPGLGQAYVGSYWRAGMYVAIETGLVLGWRHYVVTLHDRQVNKYQKHADEHWSHGRYEDYYNDLSTQSLFDGNPEALMEMASTREEFCNAVFVKSSKANSEYQSCVEFGPYEADKLYDTFPFYSSSRYERHDQSDPLPTDSIGIYRREFYQDLHSFYELVGKHNEYLPGWDDAENVIVTDTSLNGESENRAEYRRMRNKATEYSRMQAGFLGAIVINHLVSALDAALTARFHNKKLYETEVRWWDRTRLESFVAFDGWYPKSFIQAYVPF